MSADDEPAGLRPALLGAGLAALVVVVLPLGALVREGHDVTLFASGDSVTSARLAPGCDHALWRDPECRETLPHHVRLMDLVFREAHRFDIIHFHCDYVHFPLVRYHRTPITFRT